MIGKGLNTRAEILRAYNDLTYEKGVKSVTIRDIAQRAGISIGNLYYYFKKKSEISYAISKDYYAKVSIILKDYFPEKIIGLEKLFLELYTSIVLYCEVIPLQNFALEAADDLALLEPNIEALFPMMKMALVEENLDTNDEKIALAIRSCLVVLHITYKFSFMNDLNYNPKDIFRIICGVFFSIIGMPAKPYIDRVFAHIEKLDEAYIVKQIYTLQDYDYEFIEDN